MKGAPHFLRTLPHGKTPNGAKYIELGVFKNSELELIQLRVNQKLPSHFHVKTSSIFYMIQGRGRILLGKKWHAYKAGDVFSVPRKMVHALHSRTQTVFLAHESPPIEHPKTGKVDMRYL